MKRIFISISLAILGTFLSCAQVTLEDCLEKAEANYPLIKKYNLIENTLDIDLSEINQSWLPRIGLYGQATIQNSVPSFPQLLSGMLSQMGQSIKGLDKLQYKVGAELSQPVWDGGATRARREVSHAREQTSKAALEVELYTIRQRVESIFFAILLTNQQISQNELTYSLLQNNLQQLKAMLKNGVAMQSDVDMVEAQALIMKQNIAHANSAAEGYRKVLEIFIGEHLENCQLVKPSLYLSDSQECNRPELTLFARRLKTNNTLLRLYDSARLPSIGFFAQAYYGYPGFNYFESMMTRNLSFNIMAGVKVAWNIDSFYSKKNEKGKISADAAEIEIEKEVFLFNNRMQATSQREKIDALTAIIQDDTRIILLRENVRKAAESQLRNGIIDTTALLSKITDENMSRLNATLHEIQLLQESYNLKYILNQ